MVAHLIDQYDIRDRPSAEEPAVQQYDEFGDPVGQYPQEGVTAYAAEVGQIVGADPAAVGQFLAANPIARDPTIQAGMVDVAREMIRQGYQPDAQTMLTVAIEQASAGAPRQARQQAQDNAHAARVNAASGMVSGSGSSAVHQTSDDLDAIINEIVPQW